MSSRNLNFVMAYVLLVGVPVGALVGVLKHGKNLTAPKSVDGNWQLQSGLSQLASLPCGVPTINSEEAVLNISQSGKNFELVLPNGFRTHTSGIIDGMNLTATLAPAIQPQITGCGKGKAVTLVASLNTVVQPRTLSGTVAVEGCPTCSPISFVAVPQPPVVKKGAH